MNVGKIFIERIPRMTEVYKSYCRNYHKATAMLEKLQKDANLVQLTKECLDNVKYVFLIVCLVLV